jgi:hypothetical protein
MRVAPRRRLPRRPRSRNLSWNQRAPVHSCPGGRIEEGCHIERPHPFLEVVPRCLEAVVHCPVLMFVFLFPVRLIYALQGIFMIQLPDPRWDANFWWVRCWGSSQGCRSPRCSRGLRPPGRARSGGARRWDPSS